MKRWVHSERKSIKAARSLQSKQAWKQLYDMLVDPNHYMRIVVNDIPYALGYGLSLLASYFPSVDQIEALRDGDRLEFDNNLIYVEYR